MKNISIHQLRLSAVTALLVAITWVLVPGVSSVFAQGVKRPAQQRKQNRLKQQLERENKRPANTGNDAKEKPEQPGPRLLNARPESHSLDGIQQRGIAEFFTPDERSLVIPGFGRAPTFLIVLRQLDLTDEQKNAIRLVRRRIGNQLSNLRIQHNRAEQQLEEAIYGENFDQAAVEEIAKRSGETLARITVMQANIESQFRQILTPDQFFVFRFLVGEMLLPQRRVQPNQLRQQNQRRPVQPPFED